MKHTALVTGSSGGIGLEIAKIHAENGGDLILVARSTTKLKAIRENLESKYGVSVEILPKDLSIPDAAEEIYHDVSDRGIEVDFLMNCAGFGDYGYFHETNWEKEEMMINLNMLALTQLTKLFGRKMISRRYGHIMNVASTAAFFPGPLMSVYYATKHYVLAFTEGIANEWADFGVKVSALCPGPTATGFQVAAELEGSKLVKGRKLATPEEVARFGYRSLLDGRIVAVHGFTNKLLSVTFGLLPDAVTAKLVRNMQERSR